MNMSPSWFIFMLREYNMNASRTPATFCGEISKKLLRCNVSLEKQRGRVASLPPLTLRYRFCVHTGDEPVQLSIRQLDVGTTQGVMQAVFR